jgi:RNA polymerase sigma-70 factor (ECF subfamily)
LLRLATTPRAIALGEVEGPGAALAILEDLDLDDYHLFHATRADLLRRLGRLGEAARAYARAADLAPTDAEHAFLVGRVTGLGSIGGGDVLVSPQA